MGTKRTRQEDDIDYQIVETALELGSVGGKSFDVKLKVSWYYGSRQRSV